MDTNQFREAAHAAIEDIIEYYNTLPSRQVVSSVSPGYLAPQLPTTAPTTGEPWSAIQPDIDRLIMPGLTHWQHPNFMAFFPANASFPGIVGEMYSSAFTAAAFNWLCSPAITELETVMLDWVAQMLGLPECFLSKGEGGGVIQGTASEVIATVMVAARERALGRQAKGLEGKEAEDRIDACRGKMVALGSEQAHSSTQKGAIIAGTKFRTVSTKREDNYAMKGAEVKRVLEECKANGLIPYYITVSLGTTGTCAVDEFDAIAEVLKDWPDVWVHVDAAYAGSALVLPEYQHLTKSFVHFDSFNVNMHKWMLTNFDCSCMYVKKRSDLTTALSITPSYLRNAFSDSGLVTDYRDWQIPLGRRFRALKVWFVLRSYGISGIQAHIRGHIRLGEIFGSLIKTRPDVFEILTGPVFALTVFTVLPRRKAGGGTRGDLPDSSHERYLNDFTPDASGQALMEANAVTQKMYERVNEKGEIYITSSVIGGVYAIRVVSGSPAAEEKYIRRAFEILVETAEEVLGEPGNAAKD
ncbi:aromatic-L-amino-acid decarboxylase [Microthyrium microscopicum]|uniref:Aromatic-L-amino-acid decarboxylase n=1 Tax=Microthyrium microscopicum TaxID=703497 RepID=A0A6A6UGH0_9PEZI|nr:aromatic-L-amino-acid decarboxylase [Microthyrium microscopicum]